MTMNSKIMILKIVLTASLVGAFQTPGHVHCRRARGVPLLVPLQVRVFGRLAAVSSTEQEKEQEKQEQLIQPYATAVTDKNYIENPYYLEGNKPDGAPTLAAKNFARQSPAILEELYEVLTIQIQSLADPNVTSTAELRKAQRLPGCLYLGLTNEAVDEAERLREARPGGKVKTNPVARGLYDFGCLMLDSFFDGRPIQRFWFLEVVARIPYFSYTSMLHLYESLGWWRAPELRKIHNAEEWNELHHLLIMEALGGNSQWSDRFLGYHAAIVYYWLLNAVFLFSPRVAYQFMELLEAHAVDTYGTFLKENKNRLQELPAPEVAKSYYTSADLYMFDEFQVSRPPGTRRPPCDNLYDVFSNICDDEGEHVKTMQACQDYAEVGSLVVSPHTTAIKEGKSLESVQETEEKRKKWLEWAETFQHLDLDARADDSGDFEYRS